MKKSFAAVLAALIALGSPALAADKYVTYNLSKKRAAIKGLYIVDGYSTGEVQRFVNQDCNGKIGQMKLVGKPRKKRGHLIQKFEIDCPGGPAARYPSAMSIEIQKMDDGRHLVEMFGGDGAGNLVQSTEYRKP